VRPAVRAELRAPVAGFVQAVAFDEGERVAPGVPVACLEIPDLASRLAQKRAEVREVQARLRLLEAGPRYEEVEEQRRRVGRLQGWRDLAQKDLAQARQALHEELARLDKQAAQYQVELDGARDVYDRSKHLRGRGALAEETYREAERRFQVAQTQLAQAQFQKRHRQALGTREAIAGLDAEAELARRDKDLADAQGTLTLLQAGTRPEEIEAERARLARLQEEARYLETLQGKVHVVSPVPGLITTPRLKEKVGQYVREGEPICLVEEPAELEAEVTLAEQDVARVRPGQAVELKARALPFETFQAQVERIAPRSVRPEAQAGTPAAGAGEVPGSVTVYCRLAEPQAELRPGMTGYARIYSGRRSVGTILLDRALRLLRTEFWW
jgi:multidrug resistance efflux pump